MANCPGWADDMGVKMIYKGTYRLTSVINFFKVVCKKLLRDYDWIVVGPQDVSYKTLPVARPRQTVLAKFTKRNQTLFW